MKKYYTLTVSILSPMHIASGKTISKLEYVYSAESQTINIIDKLKLSRFLTERKLMEVFLDRLRSDDLTFSLTSFFNEKAITENEYKELAAYSYKNENVSVEPSQMAISEFIKDAYGCPYIPGSSLKGAIRNAIAYDEIMDNIGRYSRSAENIKAKLNDNKALSAIEKDINARIFHTLNRKQIKDKETGNYVADKKSILNDCMAGLYISDSRPLSQEDLILCEKTDLDIEGDTHSINILRECLRPDTKAVFDVVIDTSLCPFDADRISESLKYLYKDYDHVFRSRFIDEEEETVHIPQKDNSSEYIYLGGGTGFPLKTVMYALYKDEEEAARIISLILDKSFKSAEHKVFTAEEGISPKVLKCARFQNRLYEMGRCSVNFKEKKV